MIQSSTRRTENLYLEALIKKEGIALVQSDYIATGGALMGRGQDWDSEVTSLMYVFPTPTFTR
uniref:Uncharacterized protein n=1 Tax=Romanomermis culicivorax TaxID=13658 RepID=A0A915JSN6_ROMCU